jgi:hypothetical protein
MMILDDKLLNNNFYTLYKKYYDKTSYSIVTNMNALKSSKYLVNDYSSFVSTTDNFTPKNKNELLNVYYTILNNGWKNFSFYCDPSYTSCLDDVSKLSDDNESFSNINQLVHPYNSYNTIQSTYSSNGRIDLTITNKYSDEEILKIDNKINDIINELNINDYKSTTDKIKVFHDYIAKTNKYDTLKEDNFSNYNSNTAIGTLFEGYSICSGYTDTMAIFLTKIGLENVRIANENHTWNAVKINNTWKHIDLTWDDPVTNTGEDIIMYDYFLISTNELLNKDQTEHTFDSEIYDFIN